MSIEAMKQALEVLEQINQLSIGENAISLPGEIDAAMDALRAAIEQAGKPVAWIQRNHLEHAQREPSMCRVEPTKRLPDFVPLYTVPRQWIGLTEEDKAALDEQYGNDTLAHLDAIEAKLKEKNT
jgi:nicotinamidase-related amidase